MVVEQTFEKPLTTDELNDMAKRVDPCLEAHGAKWMRSYISADRKRLICEFEAPDAEAVRTSMRSAEVSFDRVWSAEVYRLGEPEVK